MAYDNKEIRPSYTPREYQKWELEEFNREVQDYFKFVSLVSGKEVKVFDEKQYLIDNKALNFDGAVILTGVEQDEYGTMKSYNYPSKYQQLSEKIEQWKSMMFRTEAIEKRKLEGLEELASTMKLN